LYINKGHQNFTTLKNYWKKSAGYKGDEIEISTKDFKFSYEMISSFTIGVYSREDSKFNLMYSPGFGNIINLKF